MKNILVFFFLLIFYSLAAGTICEKDKIYIESSTVQVDPNGLTVKINGNAVLVSAIYSDNDGLYILKPLKSWCDQGHSAICFFCEGCGVWYCPHYCGCSNKTTYP